MSEAEIEEIIESFVQAARRAKESGFDGVEIFAAYHAIVDQFWTPFSNRRTDKWGGNIPDRLITFQYPKIRLGQQIGGGYLARVHNFLTTAPRDFGFPNVTVHFHGGHQPSPADGFPHDISNRPSSFPAQVTIPVGGFHDYAYPFADVGIFDGPIEEAERPSTYWFHDHFLDFTGQNVYRGLANIAPAFDELDAGDETASDTLALPSGAHDIPLVLMDKTFDISGTMVFDPFNGDGFLGDTMTVNGVVQPYCRVQRRKYRFRFLNGSNARLYQIFATNDLRQTFPMTQIATEGGLLGHPIRNLQSFSLFMSERVEVVELQGVDLGRVVLGRPRGHRVGRLQAAPRVESHRVGHQHCGLHVSRRPQAEGVLVAVLPDDLVGQRLGSEKEGPPLAREIGHGKPHGG